MAVKIIYSRLLKRIIHQRIILLIIFTVAIVGGIAVYQKVKNREFQAVPSATCINTSTAFLVPLPPLDEVSQDASVIVTADMEESGKDNAHNFKVIENLKGTQLRKGDMISVCGTPAYPLDGASYKPALLFLQGVDKEQKVWVPEHYEMGIIPSTGRGSFKMWPANDSRDYSLDDVRRAIDKTE